MAKKKNIEEDRQYADAIYTDHGWVRLSTLNVDDEISIKGHKIKGRDIPFSVYTLQCGHVDKGYAVTLGTLLFCDTCGTREFVSAVR